LVDSPSTVAGWWHLFTAVGQTFQQKLGGSGENKGGREVLFEQHNNNTMYE